jgi:hypothetical protein
MKPILVTLALLMPLTASAQQPSPWGYQYPPSQYGVPIAPIVPVMPNRNPNGPFGTGYSIVTTEDETAKDRGSDDEAPKRRTYTTKVVPNNIFGQPIEKRSPLWDW